MRTVRVKIYKYSELSPDVQYTVMYAHQNKTYQDTRVWLGAKEAERDIEDREIEFFEDGRTFLKD